MCQLVSLILSHFGSPNLDRNVCKKCNLCKGVKDWTVCEECMVRSLCNLCEDREACQGGEEGSLYEECKECVKSCNVCKLQGLLAQYVPRKISIITRFLSKGV